MSPATLPPPMKSSPTWRRGTAQTDGGFAPPFPSPLRHPISGLAPLLGVAPPIQQPQNTLILVPHHAPSMVYALGVTSGMSRPAKPPARDSPVVSGAPELEKMREMLDWMPKEEKLVVRQNLDRSARYPAALPLSSSWIASFSLVLRRFATDSSVVQHYASRLPRAHTRKTPTTSIATSSLPPRRFLASAPRSRRSKRCSATG